MAEQTWEVSPAQRWDMRKGWYAGVEAYFPTRDEARAGAAVALQAIESYSALRAALANLLLVIHDPGPEAGMRLVGIVSDRRTHAALDAARDALAKSP